jgi:hypothetical protein
MPPSSRVRRRWISTRQRRGLFSSDAQVPLFLVQSAMSRRPARWLARILYFIAVVVLAFEEWIWNHASALLRRIGNLLPFRWIEGWVRRRTPPQALSLFVLPILVVLPLKGVALGAIGHGHMALGIAVLSLDKVIGTAVFARLWQITEPAITTYGWVRAGRDAFLRLRQRLYDWLHEQPAYRSAHALLERLRREEGGILQRLRAELRRQRRERQALRAPTAPR